MDAELYIEILSSKIEEMNITLRFDNDPKHKILHAHEFNQKNNIKIID